MWYRDNPVTFRCFRRPDNIPAIDSLEGFIDGDGIIFQVNTNFMIAATQVLTIMCLIKGNPAWKGSLALLFIGGAARLFYKYDKYEEKPYIQVGIVLGLLGVALFIWFGITG